MTSPYLLRPLRTLAEAKAQREELRHTVRNCDLLFALASGSSPRAAQRGDMMRAEMCIGHAAQMVEDVIEESGDER